MEDLVVAEKSICTDGIISGATRLQPVAMEIGQASRTIAALSNRNNCKIREVSVREIQSILSGSGARSQPYLDLDLKDPDFNALRRVGPTGLLKAEGRNVGWADEMWMHIESESNLDSIWRADASGAFQKMKVDWKGNIVK